MGSSTVNPERGRSSGRGHAQRGGSQRSTPPEGSAVLAVLALSLAILVSLGFGLTVVAGPEPAFVTRLPDDSFYYLVIAKNVATSGMYSFDGGQTTATGFHPLWLQILVPLARLSGGDDVLLMRLAVGTTLGISALIALSGSLALLRRRPAGLLLALALGVSSYSFLNGAVSALEWPLAVAASAALFALLASRRSGSRPMLALAFAIGAAGSLARSDFGGVPLVATLLAVAVGWRRGDWRFFWPSWLSLIGAGAGLFLVVLQVHSISGEWVSGSSYTKAVWGQAFGANPLPIVHQFARALLYIPALHAENKMALKEQLVGVLSVALPVLLAAAGVGAWLARRSLASVLAQLRAGRGSRASRERFFTLLSGAVIVFYALFYSLNPLGVQSWYTAHVFVPAICLSGVILGRVFALLGPRARRMGTTLVFSAVMGNLALFAVTPATYLPQSKLRQIGIALAESRQSGALVGRIGWADAGIVGFYQGGSVINTDGLVNDEIGRYLPDRLHCYLLHKQIRYVSSFGWVAERHLMKRAWDSFSQPRSVAARDGLEFDIREVDFDSLAGFDECARSDLAR